MSKPYDGIVREVFCKVVMEGIHNWDGCNIPEVMYLASPHRHLFHIKATADVDHEDRDIEFIKLKHDIQIYLVKKYHDADLCCLKFGSMSCEMIAHELGVHFKLSKVEVSEDNENGCVLYFSSSM